MIKSTKSNEDVRKAQGSKEAMSESLSRVPWGAEHERDYLAITSMSGKILDALNSTGHLSIREALALAPSDTELDQYEIVLNSLDELTASGRIRRIVIANAAGGEQSIGYELTDKVGPAVIRRRAMGYLATMRSLPPIERGDLRPAAEAVLKDIIAERNERRRA